MLGVLIYAIRIGAIVGVGMLNASNIIELCTSGSAWHKHSTHRRMFFAGSMVLLFSLFAGLAFLVF